MARRAETWKYCLSTTRDARDATLRGFPLSRKIHTLPNRGASDDWITPQPIIEALGGWESFDLDPCCPATKMPWWTAKRSIQQSSDGLAEEWKGRVWLNPPYGGAIVKWLAKLAEHGNGIVPARTEVESWFWPFIWERADAILFLRGRLYFHKPDGSRLGNAGHGSVLVAYGKANVKALHASGIAGKLIELSLATAPRPV